MRLRCSDEFPVYDALIQFGPGRYTERELFHKVGRKLPKLAHRGAIFDPSVEKIEEDSDVGDIDIALDTCLKLSSLAPTINPKILSAMTGGIRPRSKSILKQALNSCYPFHEQNNISKKKRRIKYPMEKRTFPG